MGSPARPVSESPEWGFTVGAMPFAKHKLRVSSCSYQHTHIQKQRPGLNSESRVRSIRISFFYSYVFYERKSTFPLRPEVMLFVLGVPCGIVMILWCQKQGSTALVMQRKYSTNITPLNAECQDMTAVIVPQSPLGQSWDGVQSTP